MVESAERVRQAAGEAGRAMVGMGERRRGGEGEYEGERGPGEVAVKGVHGGDSLAEWMRRSGLGETIAKKANKLRASRSTARALPVRRGIGEVVGAKASCASWVEPKCS
jgi:hypothetical protein